MLLIFMILRNSDVKHISMCLWAIIVPSLGKNVYPILIF